MGAKRLKSHANIKINKSLLVFCYSYHLFNRMFKHKITLHIFKYRVTHKRQECKDDCSKIEIIQSVALYI